MFLFVGMSAWNGPPDRGLMAAGFTLLLLMVISLWIVLVSVQDRKGSVECLRPRPLAQTAFYLYFGFQFLMPVANTGQRGRGAEKTAS